MTLNTDPSHKGAKESIGQGSKAGGIGYQEECAPTLKASESGSNMVPSVLCLNDQGGNRWHIKERRGLL